MRGVRRTPRVLYPEHHGTTSLQSHSRLFAHPVRPPPKNIYLLPLNPTKNLTDGPFDPDAAFEEVEMTRSGAFDAAERPVVSPMAVSKINVIGEGLSKRREQRGLLGREGVVPPPPASSRNNPGEDKLGVTRCICWCHSRQNGATRSLYLGLP